MRKHHLRLFGAWSLAAGAVAAAACAGSRNGGDPRCGLEAELYGGNATDETCMTMLDAEQAVQVGHADAATVISPVNGSAIASSAATVTFSWTSPIDDDGDASLRRTAPRTPPAWRRVLARLAPISTAWAHDPPVTGAIHMVRVTGAGHDEILFFTTQLHWTLDDHNREHVLEAAGPVSIEITSAYLTENRILNASDGPFRPVENTTFTVSQ